MPRLLIADGSSQIHRTFHALARMGQNLTAPDGTPTGALLAFLNVLRKAVRQHEPTHLAVTFDKSRKSFRTDLYPEYKQQREATPEELVAQLKLAREALKALRIPLIELDGYEADDAIATLAHRAHDAGTDVVILSSDKDLMQLVGPGVVLHHAQRDEVMDEKAVEAYFGVPPERVADILAIMGDSSDNIPGVKGIGEKGATLLVQRHGSIENILSKLDEIEGDEELGRTRKRMAALLREQADDARLARRLTDLDRNAPVAESMDDLALREPDPEPTRALFTRLGFTKLLSDLKLGAAPAKPGEAEAHAAAAAAFEVVTEANDAALARLEKDARAAGRLALCVLAGHPEGQLPLGDAPATLGLCAREGAAMALPIEALTGAARTRIAALLADASLPKCGHAMKPAWHALRAAGLPVNGTAFDADVAAGLIEWGRWRDLATLASDVLGETRSADDAKAPRRAAWDAHAAFRLQPMLRSRLHDGALERVFDELEAPVLPVLVDMEETGIRIDPKALEALRKEMQERLDVLTAECHRLAGREFNIASPKQLGEVLFTELGLTPGGQTAKTGVPSTASDVLDQLVDDHPIVAKVLEHREISKLLGTYVEVLPHLARPSTSRVHATFNQLGAETGRLSCTDPNLQNIPIRSELGRRIRTAFVADPGSLLVGADYSQVELRIMAHVSDDDALCEAFARGEDVHRATAAKMFSVMPELVTSEMRSRAKVINFGVIYGMTAHGVASRLGCSRADGQALIDGYFGAYPRMKETIERLIEDARAHPRHEARTLFGRARALPEIVSKNGTRRAFAERAAVNTVIQGTAADIMKLAMIRVDRRLKESFPEARLLVQVHDELLVEAPEARADDVLRSVIGEMEAVFTLRAPLLAVGGKGRTWYDIK